MVVKPELIAGIDEAGRGPWAGPVVAAAVVFSSDIIPDAVNDSKKLTAKKREGLFQEIYDCSYVGVGVANVYEIDRVNILQATMLAMQRAFSEIAVTVDLALVDGNKSPELPCETQAVIKGDSLHKCISAASIIAKVTRDRMMAELHGEHPHYGWQKNAGYGTKEHIAALDKHGVTEHHRKSFAPIRKLLEVA